MLSDASNAVQFTGCDLHYHSDTPAFALGERRRIAMIVKITAGKLDSV